MPMEIKYRLHTEQTPGIANAFSFWLPVGCCGRFLPGQHVFPVSAWFCWSRVKTSFVFLFFVFFFLPLHDMGPRDDCSGGTHYPPIYPRKLWLHVCV